MTYTIIDHQKRKALSLTNSEYICLDTIYHLNNNPKFKILNKTYLADIVWISRQALTLMIKRLVSLSYLTEDEKITKQVYDTLYWEIAETGEMNKTNEVSVKKVDTECKESWHNNNIIINNKKNNNKLLFTKDDIVKFYNYYIDNISLDKKYHNKTKSLILLEKEVIENWFDYVKKWIEWYFKATDKKYRIALNKLLNLNSQKWTYYKDFITDWNFIEKKLENIDIWF